MYGFGSNTKGRMGFEGEGDEDILFPKEIPGLVNIVKVNCGYWHSLALDANGQAWSAGYGGYGELGRVKARKSYDTFCPVEQSSPFCDISCGVHCSFFIE